MSLWNCFKSGKSKSHTDIVNNEEETFEPITEIVPLMCEICEQAILPAVEPNDTPIPASVDVDTAHTMFSDSEIQRRVIADSEKDFRYGDEGKEAIINVDTLSARFDSNTEINIAVLKANNLISKKAKRIKLLARGELTKKFTVVADSYSADAAKMLLAVGGKMILLHKRGEKHE